MALSFYRRSVSERRNIMSFFSWLRNSLENRARRARPRPPAPRFRPRLEALEDRCVPTSTTLKVTSLLDNGPGSLRYEIAQAQSNDTIVFDFGNRKANSTPHTITLTSGELYINKNLTIQGPGAGLLTVTSTNVLYSPSYGPSRIFEVYSAKVTLSAMTISHGDGERYYRGPDPFGTADYYDGNGGGVLNLGTLTINGCFLISNSAYASSGIYVGGGGAIANFGTLTVSNSTLSNNYTSGNGGGIYNDFRGTLTVSGCTVSGNIGGGTGINQGGGIYNGGALAVSNSTLSGNSSYYGGGIYSAYGTATVSGCTLSENDADFGGGGIYNAGNLTILESIFTSNGPDNILGSYTDGGG